MGYTNGKSYDDPVKALAREKLRDFVLNNLPGRRRNLRVVCFPGAESEGQEALEVKQVYDSLYIPRANIVGLEADPKRAERLRKANLGIEVITAEANDFFKHAERKFDIISLDYCGPQTLKEANTLTQIAARQVLTSNGIVCTNYLGKRESGSLKSLLAGRVLHGMTPSVLQIKMPAEADISEFYQTILEERLKLNDSVMAAAKEDIPSEELREGISFETRSIFLGGSVDLPTPRHLFADHPSLPLLFEAMRKYYEEGHADEGLKKHARIIEQDFDKLKIETKDNLYNLTSRNFFLEEMSRLATDLVKKFSLDANTAQALVRLANEKHSSPYHINKVERYSYVSNSGSPMLFDLFSFRKAPQGLLQRVEESIHLDNKNGRLLMNIGRLPHARFWRELDSIARDYKGYTDRDSLPFPKRIFLGSSAKPVLTKARAIQLMREGKSLDEIRATHRGWANKPLPQWKAHVTMGTYDDAPKANRDETISQDIEDSDLERITKDQALDLLASGIPPQEINGAYPTSFTVRQLGAFKAWQTMRSRDTNGDAK